MKKVLIVEDSPLQRAVIVNIVKELGYEPIQVETFEVSLVPLLKKHSIDLVLLDLLLMDENGRSVADGFQVCAELKQANPDLKVIVITAENDDSAKEFAILQGADAFISKPFQVDKLAKCIDGIGLN